MTDNFAIGWCVAMSEHSNWTMEDIREFAEGNYGMTAQDWQEFLALIGGE